jgi:hypothetical protein
MIPEKASDFTYSGRERTAHSASSRAAQVSMRGDVTLAPFLGGHRLVRDSVNDIGLLRPLVEHPQVLAQRNEGRQLVMHPDADTAAMAVAVFSSSLSLGTSETALVTTFTR